MMSLRRLVVIGIVLGLGLLTLAIPTLALPAFAHEARGPAFGSNKVSTAIQSVGGEADVDDYVAPLLAGETLTVTVGASKKSALLPDLVVLDPDGTDRTPTLNVKSGGKKVAFKKLVIDKTGEWVVRIRSANTTEGEYSASFKIGKAKAISLKKQTLDASVATEVTHTFPGLEGALASISIAYSKKGAALNLVSLLDPQGADVPSAPAKLADDFVLKGTKLSVKKAPLATGDGDYGLTLGVATGIASYSVKIAVVPQGRPKKKAKIPAAEPFLDAVARPVRGVAGIATQLRGLNLGDAETFPTVLFDDVLGNVTSVAPDGTSLLVEPPAALDGATVDVVVIDAFGQAAQRDGHFFYVPPPTLTALVDDGDAAIPGGSTAGGLSARLLGTGLATGQSVSFGVRSATRPNVVSTSELRVVTPSSPATGTFFVVLTDEFGRQIISPFQFEYKTPPGLDAIATRVSTRWRSAIAAARSPPARCSA